ncbi:hypothetical protein ANN_14266 [Periplaneta americana]|uniref:Uncharacterized protein n=1 Tax=Periplaneta americana TaxID=6978 RepID=A0ABQ8SVU4_PERAM|nr:hypothetical protein ANN_14266 [Periplaneta americana]
MIQSTSGFSRMGLRPKLVITTVLFCKECFQDIQFRYGVKLGGCLAPSDFYLKGRAEVHLSGGVQEVDMSEDGETFEDIQQVIFRNSTVLGNDRYQMSVVKGMRGYKFSAIVTVNLLRQYHSTAPADEEGEPGENCDQDTVTDRQDLIDLIESLVH